jgi:hypothetical protein
MSEKQGKIVHNPWDFSAPKYDDRCKQNAGTFYGVGRTNPVGHTDGVKQHVATFPQENQVKSL